MESIIWLLLSAIAALFTWEYCVLDVETIWRPSFPLERTADFLSVVFMRVGRFLAYVSSFYQYIKWEKLLRTGNNLLAPLLEILLSWLYIIQGYTQYAIDTALSIKMLNLGLLTLCCVVIAFCAYFVPEQWAKAFKDAATDLYSKVRGRFDFLFSTRAMKENLKLNPVFIVGTNLRAARGASAFVTYKGENYCARVTHVDVPIEKNTFRVGTNLHVEPNATVKVNFQDRCYDAELVHFDIPDL